MLATTRSVKTIVHPLFGVDSMDLTSALNVQLVKTLSFHALMDNLARLLHVMETVCQGSTVHDATKSAHLAVSSTMKKTWAVIALKAFVTPVSQGHTV